MPEALPHQKKPTSAQPPWLVDVPDWTGGRETKDKNISSDFEYLKSLSGQELAQTVATLVQGTDDSYKVMLKEIVLSFCSNTDYCDNESYYESKEKIEIICDSIMTSTSDYDAVEILRILYQTASDGGSRAMREIFEKRIFDIYCATPEMISEPIARLGEQGYADGASGESLMFLAQILRQAAFARNRGVSEKEIEDFLSRAREGFSQKTDNEQNPYLLNCQYDFFVDSLTRQIEKKEYGLMYESFEQARAKARPALLTEGVYTKTVFDTGRVHYSTNVAEITKQMQLIETLTKEWFDISANKDADYTSKAIKKEQLEYDLFEADIALGELFDKELDESFLQEQGVDQVELLADYQFIISSRVRSDIESQFHIMLSDLTIKEQFYFIHYLKQVALKDSDRMKEFVALYGNGGLRTFLALENNNDTEKGESDKTLGDSIVEVSQQEEVARQVFSAYSSLLDELDDIEDKLCRLYGCKEEVQKQMISHISKGIEKRATELLKECVKKLRGANEEDRAIIYEDVYRKLRQVSADTVFLNESFPEVKKENPDLKLEHIAGVGLQIIDNGSVINNPTLLQQMRDIYITNWEDDDTGRDGEEMMNELEERLRGEGRVYFALLDGDDGTAVLSFVSVADNKDGSSYASGLNRNPELGVGSIGRTLINRVLHEEALGKRLTAKAKHGSLTAHAYVNQYGSLGVGIEEKNEKVSLLLAYDAELRGSMVSSSWKSRKMAEQEASRYIDKVAILEYPTLEKEKSMYENGYVLTKFFSGGAVVFERPASNQSVVFRKAA